MKAKYLLMVQVMVMLVSITVIAQDPSDHKHSVKTIPFGQKMLPPDLTKYSDKFIPETTYPGENAAFRSGITISEANAAKKDREYHRQLRTDNRKMKTPLLNQKSSAAVRGENENCPDPYFHLVKDINSLAESYPTNNSDLYPNPSYAVLDHVIYFAADDGIHGNEFWRSDGTATGTYMLTDAEAGLASSDPHNITAVNGKIYFSATTSSYGNEPWVSDGTADGTHLLMDIAPDINSSSPGQFFNMGKKTYFIANSDLAFWGAIYATDGTTEGTQLVLKDIGNPELGGDEITQPTVVNGLLFFTFLNFETFAWELWRSDGTAAGTYHVGTNTTFINIPAQLTGYNNKLYFSTDDGAGYKLWVSDGTDAGTIPAPGNMDVLVNVDYLGTSFPILNNALYIPGETPSEGNGLYKYDATSGESLVKIKDLAPQGDTAVIVPLEMKVVNNTLYFKVTSFIGGIHDELWSSKGTKATTQPVFKYLPEETINQLYNGNGTLYFVKHGKFFGTELWKIFDTFFGSFPVLESDVFKGATSSFPGYLTAFEGRIAFSAADEQKGTELFMTNRFGFGATLVKDINTVSTSSSDAGFTVYTIYGYNGMAALGKDVLFIARDRVHGNALYKTDGTAAGTQLLNDIVPGEAEFYAHALLSKNDAAYFIAETPTGNTLYKTNGTAGSLRKITPDYDYLQSFKIADNGFIFYTVHTNDAPEFELWRTDGTAQGTVLLSSTVYPLNYLNVIGNTAVFVAGDPEHGYELWRSNGSVAGTRMVKDINPGVSGGVPGGMFLYNKEVYFSAYDSTSSNPSFWKSDATKAGTIRVANIDPWWATPTVELTDRLYYCVSNNILYFAAVDHNDGKGTQLWKTDGTVKGTKAIKDIDPTNSDATTPGPTYLTDVNGTVFFTANDGVHGIELWKTDGTTDGTQLVKDITPGDVGSSIAGLTSFAGKLFFQNREEKDGLSRYYLWSSDGTEQCTKEVTDPGINNVIASAIFLAGDKLYITGYNHQYGAELYVSKDDQSGRYVRSTVVDKIEKNIPFSAVLYPNPSLSNSTLQIKGKTTNVSVSITDMNGRKLWESGNSNAMRINLPMEKFAAGTYIVTITSDMGCRNIKLVKQ